jgi:hypothetical protein
VRNRGKKFRGARWEISARFGPQQRFPTCCPSCGQMEWKASRRLLRQRFCRTASQWPIINDGIAGVIEGRYKNPGRVKSQGAKAAFNLTAWLGPERLRGYGNRSGGGWATGLILGFKQPSLLLERTIERRSQELNLAFVQTLRHAE